MESIDRLSRRERDVVELLLQGKSNKMIAFTLGISVSTVEFHLKHIYARFQVNTRVELILKLGKSTGDKIEKLRSSTVENPGKIAEDRGRLNSRMDWDKFLGNADSIRGKEFEMKNLMTKHGLAGASMAVVVGFLWVVWWLDRTPGGVDYLRMLAMLLIVLWTGIGLSIGYIGTRNQRTVAEVVMSTLLGTGIAPLFAYDELLALVLSPLLLAERYGFDLSKLGNSLDVIVVFTALAL